MIYALQIAAVLSGLLLVAFFKFNGQHQTKLLLSFSGAYLFAIVLLHLLPELVQSHGENIGIVVLAGFLLQIFLDFFSTGLEHGHFHKSHFSENSVPIPAIVGLFVHAFFEGLPVAMQHDHGSTQSLLWAIVLHKIPITIVLFTLLRSLHLSTQKIIWVIVLFAVASPLGTLVGAFLPEFTQLADYVTAFATGIFLHVSTTILFESSHNHKYNLAKLMVVIVGMLLAYGSLVAIGH